MPSLNDNKFIYLLLICFFSACSSGRYSASNKLYKHQVDSLAKIVKQMPVMDDYTGNQKDWVGTTNFNLRKPNYIIIHHTAQNSCDETLKYFSSKASQVSAHYVICRDGSIHHMLNDYLRAWHAGSASWGHNTDLNSSSVGIELDNNGTEVFSAAQINSLLELLAVLKKNYNVPTANILGHADIAPGRKVDPSAFFPWQRLAAQGFGIWYDTTGILIPPVFEPVQALRLIGYDTRVPEKAIRAFKLHYVPNDSTQLISDDDKKILLSLIQKSN